MFERKSIRMRQRGDHLLCALTSGWVDIVVLASMVSFDILLAWGMYLGAAVIRAEYLDTAHPSILQELTKSSKYACVRQSFALWSAKIEIYAHRICPPDQT